MGGARLPYSPTIQPKRALREDGCGDSILRVLLPAGNLPVISCSSRAEEEELEVCQKVRDLVQEVG